MRAVMRTIAKAARQLAPLLGSSWKCVDLARLGEASTTRMATETDSLQCVADQIVAIRGSGAALRVPRVDAVLPLPLPRRRTPPG